MASSPFGQAPRLREYLAWVHSRGADVRYGCVIDSDTSESRVYITVTYGAGRDKKRLIIFDMLDSVFLTPSIVRYYDRRIGMDTPFFRDIGLDEES